MILFSLDPDSERRPVSGIDSGIFELSKILHSFVYIKIYKNAYFLNILFKDSNALCIDLPALVIFALKYQF